MSDRGPGCRKIGAVGCLGILALVVLAAGISAIWAWSIHRGESTENAVLTGPSAHEGAPRAPLPPGLDELPSARRMAEHPVGRIVLELGQGEFHLRPGRPGEPTRVESTYDTKLYVLEEKVTQEDSLWVFTVRFERTAPALVSLFSSLMGGDDPVVDVYISPDEPVELDIRAEQGGVEAELGGLWITSARVSFDQGGGEISIDEPLRAPMDTFRLKSRMGGFELAGIANASPRVVDVQCSFGGAELDFDGDWRYDADIHIDVSMGGVDIALPRDVDVEGLSVSGDRRLGDARTEIPRPTLRFDVSARMGGVDASR